MIQHNTQGLPQDPKWDENCFDSMVLHLTVYVHVVFQILHLIAS